MAWIRSICLKIHTSSCALGCIDDELGSRTHIHDVLNNLDHMYLVPVSFISTNEPSAILIWSLPAGVLTFMAATEILVVSALREQDTAEAYRVIDQD